MKVSLAILLTATLSAASPIALQPRSCPHGIRFPVASSGLELCRQRCAPLAGACLLDEGYAVCVCPSDDELKRGPASASS